MDTVVAGEGWRAISRGGPRLAFREMGYAYRSTYGLDAAPCGRFKLETHRGLLGRGDAALWLLASKNAAMTQRAAIYSAPDASDYGFIEFAEPRHDSASGSFGCTLTLSLGAEESSVVIGDMIEPYAADTLGFFEELAREANGWEKPKVWESESAEVEISASHAGHHVEFAVRMRWPPLYEEERKGVLSVLPDDLPRLAEQMRGLMRREQGRRMWRRGDPPPEAWRSAS